MRRTQRASLAASPLDGCCARSGGDASSRYGPVERSRAARCARAPRGARAPHVRPARRAAGGAQVELGALNRRLVALLPEYERAYGSPFRWRGADYLAAMEEGDVPALERAAELRNLALAQLAELQHARAPE